MAVLTAQDVRKLGENIIIKQAIKKFNLPENYDYPTLLTHFKEAYDNETNEEKKEQCINTKLVIQRHIAQEQVKRNGKFSLIEAIPFVKPCPECNGLGEYIKFYKRKIDCRYCNGKGTAIITCTACKGTGKFKNKSGRIVPCRECNRPGETGTTIPVGKKKVLCTHCSGTGEFYQPVISFDIEKTTLCSKCNGTGFIKEDNKSVALNPVIPSNLGEQIKKNISE